LEIGFARVAALVLVPLISMRLFVEEKRNRSIEILFTSPVGDWEIVWGKWLGGMCAYLFFLALSGTALISAWPWHERLSAEVAALEAGLVIQACGLMAIGESLSAIFKQEGAAGWVTLLASMALLRLNADGVLDGRNIALCTGLAIAGWVLTWRSIRDLRESFCG
jgi:ABC-2 type transport system permease protein